jgi:FtsP/CotA-like multicopper oxidase with cupredoxin domain
VVLDALDDLPALAAAPDRVLVLNDPRLGATSTSAAVTPIERMAGREGDAVLLNGLLQPSLPVPAGTLARWRLLNASPSRYYALALDRHPLQVIAGDNGRLDQPRAANELVLAPGERAEVLVAVSAAGTYRLTTRPVPRGSTMMGDVVSSAAGPVTVATVEVTGPDRAAPALPAALDPVIDLAATPATRTRQVVLSMAMGGMTGGGMGGMMGSGGMGGMMDGQFRIDGRVFEAGRVDIATSVGDVEDWVVRNTSSMDHPFHLHTWPFQVLARGDGSTPAPEWKDTVNVPADSWVRIRIPFRDYRGRTVYHCHILDHEDLGMMGTVEAT